MVILFVIYDASKAKDVDDAEVIVEDCPAYNGDHKISNDNDSQAENTEASEENCVDLVPDFDVVLVVD